MTARVEHMTSGYHIQALALRRLYGALIGVQAWWSAYWPSVQVAADEAAGRDRLSSARSSCAPCDHERMVQAGHGRSPF